MGIVAQKMAAVKGSQTRAMTQLAADLRAQGRKVIALTQGEPDFATPSNIISAATRALEAGHTKYTPTPGIPELREAIVRKLRRDNGLDYKASQVTVGVGAKQVLFDMLFASLDAGDEVVIPTPCWGSYVEMVQLAGGVPVTLATRAEQRFVPQPEDLARAITPRTKWLMLNSPNNPTGSVCSEDELLAIAEVLRRHPQVWLLTDDIYEKLVYDNTQFRTIPQLAPDLVERTVVINGVSKAYSMTGWRLGYAAGPQEIIDAANIVQSQTVSHPASVSQYAALEALEGPQDFLPGFVQSFVERRNLIVNRLQAMPGLECPIPQGAFYVFPSCRNLFGRRTPDGGTIDNDTDLAMYLLGSAGVALVPGGSAFLAPGHIRISYAQSRANIVEACDRMDEALRALR